MALNDRTKGYTCLSLIVMQVPNGRFQNTLNLVYSVCLACWWTSDGFLYGFRAHTTTDLLCEKILVNNDTHLFKILDYPIYHLTMMVLMFNIQRSSVLRLSYQEEGLDTHQSVVRSTARIDSWGRKTGKAWRHTVPGCSQTLIEIYNYAHQFPINSNYSCSCFSLKSWCYHETSKNSRPAHRMLRLGVQVKKGEISHISFPKECYNNLNTTFWSTQHRISSSAIVTVSRNCIKESFPIGVIK